MRTIKGHIIVAVNESQKSDYEIELAGGLKLWMNSSFGVDRKITQPVVALVVAIGPDVEDIAPGEAVLCHHNAFGRIVSEGYLYGKLPMKHESGLSLFRLEVSMVYYRIDTEGNVLPMKGYMTVTRIPEPINTTLEVPDTAKKFYRNRFKVEAVGKGCGGIDPGDVVVTPVMSDYEMSYNYKNKLRSVIRVKYDDVVSLWVD